MEAAQTTLIAAIDEVCRTFSGSVTSWWRSPKHNAGLASAGSVTNSQHMRGLAMDVTYDGEPPPASSVRRILARYSPSLQLVRESNHDHVEQDPKLLARYQGPAVATGNASATSSPSSSTAPSGPTLSSSSFALASSTALGAAAIYPRTPLAGPGSSPLDRLFRRRS